MLQPKTIGLDGSRAFLRYRTGIEEYSYQVVKHLLDVIPRETQVRLYVRKKLRIMAWRLVFVYPEIDFSLPITWQLRGIWAPRFWTQIGLSLEMLLRPVDTLFVPAHTLPLIGGRRNIVTVHGLEYEMSPLSYGFWERWYMRLSIRYSCMKADTIISVSENTKLDLMQLYAVTEKKIVVIGEGYEVVDSGQWTVNGEEKEPQTTHYPLPTTDCILFIGRLEERKNVARIIEAFEILKERYQIPQQLTLVGKRGYGYEKIKIEMEKSKWKNEIQEKGYVTEEEKFQLLRQASVFVFPSLYEGFGLPVLEAQAMSVPVVASSTSSLPEVGGEGAVYIDPLSAESIAEGIYRVLQMSEADKEILRGEMRENLARFSWKKCAEAVNGQL